MFYLKFILHALIASSCFIFTFTISYLVRPASFSNQELLLKLERLAEVDFYNIDIDGLSDINLLKKVIIENGPYSKDGDKCLAYAGWKLDNNLGAKNELKLSLTLPRWEKYLTANKKDQKKWDRLYNSILVHELGHVKAAAATKSKLKSAKANMIRPLISKLYSFDKNYDKRTFGGKTQGVFLNR